MINRDFLMRFQVKLPIFPSLFSHSQKNAFTSIMSTLFALRQEPETVKIATFNSVHTERQRKGDKCVKCIIVRTVTKIVNYVEKLGVREASNLDLQTLRWHVRNRAFLFLGRLCKSVTCLAFTLLSIIEVNRYC